MVKGFRTCSRCGRTILAHLLGPGEVIECELGGVSDLTVEDILEANEALNSYTEEIAAEQMVLM